ncbi:MAG: zf-HC2 domain-containing protein [Gaiellaceae bacterium]
MREQVSLQLDGELSQLERRMLSAHLARCADCREYADDVAAFTDKLRYAPLERLERPVVVRMPRRVSTARLQAGIAAAFAFAALGLGSQLAQSGPSTDAAAFGSVTRFPTEAELQREVAIIEHLAFRGSRSVIPR